MDVKNLSSNWKKLQAQLKAENPPSSRSQTNGLKRKRSDDVVGTRKKFSHGNFRMADRKMQSTKPVESSANGTINSIPTRSAMTTSNSSGVHINAGLSSDVEIGKYIAIDCEMVGVGPKPDDESALARVSIVNYNGVQIYDSFVLPLEPVTDWRTHVSGITPKHMREARTLEEVQTEVAKILKGRIVVGHSVRKDFEVLLLDHPKRDIRDTARHPPYRQLAGGSSPKLKILASELLGLEIQSGEHSSIEDARATMLLFRRDKEAFDRENAKRWPTRKLLEASANADTTSDVKKSKHKKKKKKKR